MSVPAVNLNYDILGHIAEALYTVSYGTLKEYSLACTATRAASLPFIFRSVITQQHWNVDHLRELHAFTAMKPFVRSFFFAPLPDAAQAHSVSEAGRPVFKPELIAPCGAALAELLRSLPRMHTLLFEAEVHYGAPLVDAVLAALRETGLRLDSVRTLVLEANSVPTFVGHLCPRATTVSVAPPPDLETRAPWGRAPHVTCLEVREFCWTQPLYRFALAVEAQLRMPNIQNLTLNHRIYSDGLEDHLAMYRGWGGLRVLSLDSLKYLWLGYNPSSHGEPPLSAEKQAELERSEVAARNRIKRLARQTFPRLEYLWVGAELLYCFARLKPGDDKALDELQPMWVSGDREGDAVLDAFLRAHPECARFEFDPPDVAIY